MVGAIKSATKPTTSSRRYFTKSRNGCSQCKKRKVKCDEQAPCCRNCRKRGVACDFETSWPNSGEPSSSSPNTTATSQTSVTSPTNPTHHTLSRCGVSSLQNTASHGSWNVNDQHAPLQELELMHHYATTLFLSLSADCDSYRPVWQVIVPQEAQSYNFLKRGILALSSLHLSYIWSSDQANYEKAQSYKQVALNHCNSALVAFRSTVNTITASNVNAIFAFSHLMILFSFGSSKRSAKDGKMDDPICDLLDLFTLLRGAMQIVRDSWNWVEPGPMGVLLERGPPIMDRQFLPADAADALRYLEQLCELCLTDEDKRTTHQSAIQQLYDSFVMAEMKRPDWAMALRFPIIFPDSLLACLRMREPMGLVILAHYCVILYRAPMRWWVADWSAQVIEAVSRNLDHDWKPAINWPLKAISGRKLVSVDAEI